MNYRQSLLEILNKNIPASTVNELVSEFESNDWEQILLEADKQGLKLILLDRLKRQGVLQFVPDKSLKVLKEANLFVAARNMRILHHAGGILQAFNEHNLNVIVLKGIYLIEAVYRSIGMREFGDLDLLIPKKDLQKAVNIMKGLGYQLTTWYDEKDPNRDIKHIPPMIKQNAPTVELHWSILEEAAPFNIDVEGIWERAIPTRIADIEVLSLSYEDLILHLCIHQTYQHRLIGSLRNYIDIVKVIEKFDGQINWEKLIHIAKSWGVDRVIWITFNLLDDILGVRLPKSVKDQLLSDPIDLITVAQAKTLLFSYPDGMIIVTPDLAKLSSSDGFLSKIKLILSRIFLPRRVMARLYNISPNSFNVYYYYIVRFKKLYKHYGTSAWRLLNKDASLLSSAENEQMRGSLIDWMGKR
jgi:hypothetical protein